ncbi:hypothetical protein B0H13DRAFT_2286377, partial [Mycena leptocephala]
MGMSRTKNNDLRDVMPQASHQGTARELQLDSSFQAMESIVSSSLAVLTSMPHCGYAACFYRIYEFAATEDNIRFRNGIEYLYRPWVMASLPDPRDFDPQRAAPMAALGRILCASFNGCVADTSIHLPFDDRSCSPAIDKFPLCKLSQARALSAALASPLLDCNLGEGTLASTAASIILCSQDPDLKHFVRPYPTPIQTDIMPRWTIPDITYYFIYQSSSS